MKLNKKISSLAVASLCASAPAFAQGIEAEATGDVLHYGIATGTVDQPGARVQIFGSPHQGETLLVQVANAQPNSAVSVFLALAPANVSIPGIGTALVDTSNAIQLNATTDASGMASVMVTIPPTLPAGTELFAQCLVLGTGMELSSAAMIEIGEVERPLTMTSHLSGAVSLGSSGEMASASGLLSADLISSTTSVGYNAELAARASSADFMFGEANIEGLRVNPASSEGSIFWGPNDMYTTPDEGMSYPVSVTFESGGIEFGPFTTAGVLMLGDGGISLDLAPLPFGEAGPLGGVSLAYEFSESFLGGSYFDAQAGVSLPADGSDGSDVTEADVAASFASTQALLSAAISNAPGDTSFFESSMPSFGEFYDLESEILSSLTDGLASNVHDLHALILSGEMSAGDGWASLICSKLLAALGLKKGWKSFKEVFDDLCGDLLEELEEQIEAGEYDKAHHTLRKIFNKIIGPTFHWGLVEKVGDKQAGEMTGEVCSKCAPGTGPLFFIVSLLWAIIEQWF